MIKVFIEFFLISFILDVIALQFVDEVVCRVVEIEHNQQHHGHTHYQCV